MNEAVPLRILMISRDKAGLDPTSSSAERWLRLVQQGVELEVWILSADTMTWEQPGIRVIGTGGKHFFARAWRVMKQAPKQKPDLVTAQNAAELGWLGLRLARRLGAKLEVQDHSGGFDGSGAIDESFPVLRARLAMFVLKRAQAIRTVSLRSLTWLTAHVKLYSYWLPIVPRQDFAQVTRQTIPGRIVCTARFVPIKRQRLLLEAFAKLHKRQPDTSLALVGDGPLRPALEAYAEELGVSSAVLFPGWVDTLPWIAQADVFVLLSFQEGWGVAAIEAAMAGVPVVMSDTGCARFLEDRGLAQVLRRVTIDTVVEAIEKQRGKQPKPLVDVITPESFAIEQVQHWQTLCRN